MSVLPALEEGEGGEAEGLITTPTPRFTSPRLPAAGGRFRFASGSAEAFSLARFPFSISISRRWSAMLGAPLAPVGRSAVETGSQDDVDKVDVLVTGIGCILIGGPEGVSDIGGVAVLPVAATTASASSSLAEALGPGLEPLASVVTGVSPTGGVGLPC